MYFLHVKLHLNLQIPNSKSFTRPQKPQVWRYYCTQLTQHIIPKKESKNWKDNKGFTPLYMAAQEGHFQIYKLIMENVADKNATRNDGLTSLHVAAQKGNI